MSTRQPLSSPRVPESWGDSSPKRLKTIRGVCLDIDDTLSSHGKLTPEAFQALWDLKRAGFTVVPITGRPAGWCDHIARFWPVDAVVGENGAFVFYMEGGVRRRLDTRPDREASQKRLEVLAQEIQSAFPEARWASDQSYREYDLAIDICEDVPRWKPDRVDALLELCHRAGAHAKLSSIHVNAWFGDYDKRSGFEHWVQAGMPGASQKPSSLEEWIYIGDSPNDEPMFGFFEHSVGVANLAPYLPRLKFPPTWLTATESGAGFAEMAERLLASRASDSNSF